MKKTLIFILVSLLASCTVLEIASNKKKQDLKKHFTVDGNVVYYHGTPFAKYQAKTYSLDGGSLVPEYNLLLINNNVEKQLIGDLIDYVSERHSNESNEVEVEIEIVPDGKHFPL